MPGNIPTSLFKGNARIFALIDDVRPTSSKTHPQKRFYKFNGFVSVTSTITVEGSGTASVELNDIDLQYWKLVPFTDLMTRKWGDELVYDSRLSKEQLINDLGRTPLSLSLMNKDEIESFKNILKFYGEQHPALKTTLALADGDNGGLLIPAFQPQNLIWVEYLDRDGNWVKKFSGIITGVTDSSKPGETPRITLNCTTYNRLLQYSQIVTGLKNIGKSNAAEIISVSGQTPTISTIGRYAGKKFSEIVVDVFRTANNFFLKQNESEDDYRYFKVKDIFGFGEDRIKTSYYDQSTNSVVHIIDPQDSTGIQQIGEMGYAISSDKFRQKKTSFQEEINIYDYYPGSEVVYEDKQVNNYEGKEWIEVIMADEYFDDKRPYQNLVRSHLGLFNTDKMTPWEILEEIRKTVLCYIYCDGDGTIKIERPYYDIFLGTTEETPPDFRVTDENHKEGIRYVITSKDLSFIGYNHSESETQIVTRVEMQGQQDFVNNLGADVTTMTLQGFANSSYKVISKYGERIVSLKAIPNQGFGFSDFKNEILNSYCFCQKLLLSTESESITVTLIQRPDLQLNRPMIFLDKGLSFLIHTLTESFSPKEGIHYTTVKGKFVRHVGFQLINPWRWRIVRDDTNNGWRKEPWPKIKPLQIKQNNLYYGVGVSINDELNPGTANYETITNAMNYYGIDYSSGKVTGIAIRNPRTGKEFYDGQDNFYFVWTVNDENKFLTLKGHAGDFKTLSEFYLNTNTQVFAKTNIGQILNFKGNNTFIVENQNGTIQGLECTDFNYSLIRRDGTIQNESLSSVNRKVNGIYGLEQLKVFLSSSWNKVYKDDNIAYNCLQFYVEGIDEIFSAMKDLQQTNINIGLVEISNQDFSKNPIVNQETPITSDDIFIQTLYSIEKNENIIPGQFTPPSYNSIKSDETLNGGYGIMHCTQQFAGIDDINQWIEFKKNINTQVSLFKTIINSIKSSITGTYVLDNYSIGQRTRYILNYIACGEQKNSSYPIAIYDEKQNYIHSFPIRTDDIKFRNTTSGIIALVWFGLKKAMKKYPSMSWQQLLTEKQEDCLEYYRNYYITRYWNQNDVDELIRVGTKVIPINKSYFTNLKLDGTKYYLKDLFYIFNNTEI